MCRASRPAGPAPTCNVQLHCARAHTCHVIIIISRDSDHTFGWPRVVPIVWRGGDARRVLDAWRTQATARWRRPPQRRLFAAALQPARRSSGQQGRPPAGPGRGEGSGQGKAHHGDTGRRVGRPHDDRRLSDAARGPVCHAHNPLADCPALRLPDSGDVRPRLALVRAVCGGAPPLRCLGLAPAALARAQHALPPRHGRGRRCAHQAGLPPATPPSEPRHHPPERLFSGQVLVPLGAHVSLCGPGALLLPDAALQPTHPLVVHLGTRRLPLARGQWPALHLGRGGGRNGWRAGL